MKIKERFSERFSGAVIMDDVTKGEAIYEKTTREDVIRCYQETIKQRPRNRVSIPSRAFSVKVKEEDFD